MSTFDFTALTGPDIFHRSFLITVFILIFSFYNNFSQKKIVEIAAVVLLCTTCTRQEVLIIIVYP